MRKLIGFNDDKGRLIIGGVDLSDYLEISKFEILVQRDHHVVDIFGEGREVLFGSSSISIELNAEVKDPDNCFIDDEESIRIGSSEKAIGKSFTELFENKKLRALRLRKE